MQDVITREITLKATQEQVYNAITDPKKIVNWFPDVVEGTLEAGQRTVFTFIGENHKAEIYVEAARPFDYFAYRWVPGSASIDGDLLEGPNTLVEFTIEPIEAGTKVTLKESGFAALPTDVAQRCMDENSGGWEYMLDRLEKEMNKK